MKLWRFCAVFVASFVLNVAVQAAPIEAYAQSPLMGFVVISPDGQRIAFLSNAGDQRAIIIQDLNGKDSPVAIPLGKSIAEGLSWAGNDYLVFTVSALSKVPEGLIGTKQTFLFSKVYDLTNKKITILEPRDGIPHMNVVNAHPVVRMMNGEPWVFFNPFLKSLEGGAALRPALYRFNPKTGATSQVLDATQYGNEFLVGPDGDAIARTSFDRKRWKLELNRNGKWETVLTEDTTSNYPRMVRLGFTPDSIVMLWPRKDTPGESWEVRELRIKNGIEWAPNLDQDGRGLVWDPLTGLSIALNTHKAGYSFYDPEMKKIWAAILKAFPNEGVRYVSSSSDRKKVVISVLGPQSGSAFMLVDLNTGIADLIGNRYENLPSEAIASVRPIVYPAADGYLIQGQLTLPRGLEQKRNLPLIVVLNSKPESLGFDWLPQALASRGYAVLQPPDRDSFDASMTAYFLRGRKMQTDISDGVQFLARNNTIDPQRVCIVGSDYGGYAALVGITLEQDIYRCVVSVGGIANLEEYWGWLRNRYLYSSETVQRSWSRLLGIEGDSDEMLNALSPANQVKKASAPVLLIHGEEDTVVPLKQSKLMAEALKEAGKPVEFVSLKGEDHYLSQSETRTQMLLETVRFLEANNPPDAPGQFAAVKP